MERDSGRQRFTSFRAVSLRHRRAARARPRGRSRFRRARLRDGTENRKRRSIQTRRCRAVARSTALGPFASDASRCGLLRCYAVLCGITCSVTQCAASDVNVAFDVSCTTTAPSNLGGSSFPWPGIPSFFLAITLFFCSPSSCYTLIHLYLSFLILSQHLRPFRFHTPHTYALIFFSPLSFPPIFLRTSKSCLEEHNSHHIGWNCFRYYCKAITAPTKEEFCLILLMHDSYCNLLFSNALKRHHLLARWR